MLSQLPPGLAIIFDRAALIGELDKFRLATAGNQRGGAAVLGRDIGLRRHRTGAGGKKDGQQPLHREPPHNGRSVAVGGDWSQ